MVSIEMDHVIVDLFASTRLIRGILERSMFCVVKTIRLLQKILNYWKNTRNLTFLALNPVFQNLVSR